MDNSGRENEPVMFDIIRHGEGGVPEGGDREEEEEMVEIEKKKRRVEQQTARSFSTRPVREWSRKKLLKRRQVLIATNPY